MENTAKKIDFDVFVVLWNQIQGFKTPHVHIRIARWLQTSWDSGDKRLLLMAFRACGKSTLVGLFCAWLFLLKPELRIIVLAADLPLARKMVRNVKRIIEIHPLTKHLKPHNPDQWATDMFTINRDIEMRDPSMLARSVSANMTGSRADVFICDDVEVPNTCDSVDKREHLRESLKEIDFVLVPDGFQLYVGTPHHYFSIYADTPREELNESTIFMDGFQRLEIPILNDKNESAWPERFSKKQIERMRRHAGPNKFSSQMLLKPTSITEGRLNPDDLVFYKDELTYSESAKQINLKIGEHTLVSASCWWDPAFKVADGDGKKKGDSSVIAVVFTSKEGLHFLHEMEYITYDARSSLDEATQQCKQVIAFLKRNYLFSVAIEINGLGRFLPGLLKKELRAENYSASVLEKSNRRGKDVRILESFDALMAAKSLYVSESIKDTPFLQEMKEWRPSSTGKSVDDGLDAVAGALSLEPVRIGSFQTNTILPKTDTQNWRNFGHVFDASSDFDF